MNKFNINIDGEDYTNLNDFDSIDNFNSYGEVEDIESDDLDDNLNDISAPVDVENQCIEIEIVGLKSLSSFIGLDDTPIYYDNGKFFKVEDNKIVYTDIEWSDIKGSIQDNPSAIEEIEKQVYESTTTIISNSINLHNNDIQSHSYIQNIISDNYQELNNKIDLNKYNTDEELNKANLKIDKNTESISKLQEDTSNIRSDLDDLIVEVEVDIKDSISTLDEKVDGININLTKQIDDLEQDVNDKYNELTKDIDDLSDVVDNKLDKTNSVSILYGTDTEGNQVNYTAGDGIKFENNKIVNTTAWGNISGDIEEQEDLIDYLTTEHVSYENSDYPTMKNVQDALDKLLYSKPTVTLSGGDTYETGTTVKGINLTWTLNKKVISQSFNQGIGSIDASLRSYNYTSDITSNKTFTITVNDGTNTATSSTKVTFNNYYYYGTSSLDTLGDSDIRALQSSTSGGRGWCSGYTMTKRTFNCTPTEQNPDGFYIYYALPTSYVTKEPTFKVNGLNNTAYLKTVKTNYVNSSGGTVSYTIYRFMADNKLTTSYELEVV